MCQQLFLQIRSLSNIVEPDHFLYGSFLPLFPHPTWSANPKPHQDRFYQLFCGDLFKKDGFYRYFLHQSFSTDLIPQLDRFYRILLYRAPFLMRVVSTNRSHCNSRFLLIRSLIRMFSIDSFASISLQDRFYMQFSNGRFLAPIRSLKALFHVFPFGCRSLLEDRLSRFFSNDRFLPIRSLIGVFL